MIEREGSDTLQFSAANTGAASQGVDESVGPALAESNLEHAGEDVVVSLEESTEAGWVVALPAAMDAEQLKEAEQGVVKRETEVEMIKQALKLVMSEVRHIREEALVRVKASTRGKTSSRGAGSFLRKRQGRELDRADRAQLARSFTFSGSRLASPECNVAFAAQFHAGLVLKLELDSQLNSGRGLQSSC